MRAGRGVFLWLIPIAFLALGCLAVRSEYFFMVNNSFHMRSGSTPLPTFDDRALESGMRIRAIVGIACIAVSLVTFVMLGNGWERRWRERKQRGFPMD